MPFSFEIKNIKNNNIYPVISTKDKVVRKSVRDRIEARRFSFRFVTQHLLKLEQMNTSVSPFRSVNYRRIEFTSEIL
jgi:hypothetical protein